MSNQQQQQQQKVYKPLYEVQANNTTLIMTKSMKEVNDVWAKSKKCELYQFNSDGSKYIVNSKSTPIPKTTQFQLHFHGETVKKRKQNKPKLESMASPVERKVKRRRDKSALDTGGESGESQSK